MQLLASNDASFRAAHHEPLPFKFFSKEGGKSVVFPTPDGGSAGGFEIKAKSKSRAYLFVYQEWWGLNDYIKQEAERLYLALDGQVNVLALDMYDGKVATNREDAGKYMGAAVPARLEAIILGGIAYAGKRAKIASVGWCFGGGLSLKSAILEGRQAVGCVIYYGMPEKDTAKLKTLQCDVLGIFAGKEKWISPKVVAEFEANMANVGRAVTIKSFDAEHAFANPSNPKFDKTAATEANNLSVAYLRKSFGLK